MGCKVPTGASKPGHQCPPGNDAVQCCQWLSQLDQELTFTLPSEAQWNLPAGPERLPPGTAAMTKRLPRITAGSPDLPVVERSRPETSECVRLVRHAWQRVGMVSRLVPQLSGCRGTDPVSSESGEQPMMRGGNCFNGFSNDWNACSRSRSAVRLERRPRSMLHGSGLSSDGDNQ